jgi:hypothetical protein
MMILIGLIFPVMSVRAQVFVLFPLMNIILADCTGSTAPCSAAALRCVGVRGHTARVRSEWGKGDGGVGEASTLSAAEWAFLGVAWKVLMPLHIHMRPCICEFLGTLCSARVLGRCTADCLLSGGTHEQVRVTPTSNAESFMAGRRVPTCSAQSRRRGAPVGPPLMDLFLD